MNRHSLEARITKLENQNRILKIFIVLPVVAVTLAIVAGMQDAAPTTQPRIVDGDEFRLLDKQGKPRALLTMLEEGPALVFSDAQGSTRARMMLDEINGPSIAMSDHNACNRISMGVKPSGAAFALADKNGADRLSLATGDADATITLFDHRHKSRARIALDEQEQSTIHFFTTDSLPLLSVISTEEGPSIAMSDLEGHHLWCMPKDSQQDPASIVANKSVETAE